MNEAEPLVVADGSRMCVHKKLGDTLAAGKLLEELFHRSPVALALLLPCDCDEPDSCAAISEQVEPRGTNALVLKLQDQGEVRGIRWWEMAQPSHI